MICRPVPTRRIWALLVVALPLTAMIMAVPTLAFIAMPKYSSNLKRQTFLLQAATDNTQEEEQKQKQLAQLFPVLSQIQGVNWEGDCRYIDGNLNPVNLPLQGGTRYDLSTDDSSNNWTCTLTSFLVFPNGKNRQVQMQGTKKNNEDKLPTLRLDPVGGEGPISMMLTEVPPDTVLMNEIDRATGKIVMTSSLSLIVKDDTCTELVQVAHEVGGDMGATKAATTIAIEGHQVWRLHPVNEFA